MQTVFVFALVVFAFYVSVQSAHAERHLFGYIAGGGQWALNTNISSVGAFDHTLVRIGGEIELPPGAAPGRVDLLVELNGDRFNKFFVSSGFSLKFWSMKRPLGAHLTGLFGIDPFDRFAPRYSFYVGMDFQRVLFLEAGLISYSRNSDQGPPLSLPVMLGIRL